MTRDSECERMIFSFHTTSAFIIRGIEKREKKKTITNTGITRVREVH